MHSISDLIDPAYWSTLFHCSSIYIVPTLVSYSICDYHEPNIIQVPIAANLFGSFSAESITTIRQSVEFMLSDFHPDFKLEHSLALSSEALLDLVPCPRWNPVTRKGCRIHVYDTRDNGVNILHIVNAELHSYPIPAAALTASNLLEFLRSDFERRHNAS